MKFTILFNKSFDITPGFEKRDGKRESYYLLNGDYVSEYVSWDDQNKRYIVDMYNLVVDEAFNDAFNDYSSYELDYFDISCDFSLYITVHTDGYNDLSKVYSGFIIHIHDIQDFRVGNEPPGISSVSSDLSTFITVSYDCSIQYSSITSPYNYIASSNEAEYYYNYLEYYVCERKDEDYYVTIYAEQHSQPNGIYWGEIRKTFLVPAKNGVSLTLSRFQDNEPSDFMFCGGEDYNDWFTINPHDYAVISEKESLAVVEFSEWLLPPSEYFDVYRVSENLISIDGQTVFDSCGVAPIPSVVVDLLPYGNAFGGDHQIIATATDRYNSLTVDTVLSYHPIDTILTPYSLVIDVNSGKGGCSLIVDGEEVELSNDGPGTPAHIYALPRKDHDYSITVQVGNVIATKNSDELNVLYLGRCQETTIVVPAKEIFDFEEDGIYYTITSENEVIVAHGVEYYQGVIMVPSTVTHDGVTYTVTGIGYDAFANVDLMNLVLPVTISSIDSTAFSNCHIHSLIINGNGTWTAGAINADIDALYVMSTVTGVSGLTANPEVIYSYSTVPPTCDEQSFTGYDADLHIPASSLAAYFTAPYWCNFINITGDAIEPTGLTINKDSVDVLVGNEVILNVVPAPANATPREIVWTSSNDSIATVANGAITAIKVGECDIKAYLLDKIATCHVTVTEIAPTEVTLNQEFAKLEIGSQLTLTATVLPDDATDKTVTWATTNSSVATVTDAGIVTAVGQGECFITANCRDNQAMCHVIVVDHFIYITLDEHEVRLLPNHMFTLSPTVSPANTTLTVTSSEPSVAAARMANGTVQVVGVKEGTTVVKVNSSDGYAEADSCIVTVYTMRGDVNYDGFVNISDVTDLINYLLNGNSPAASFNVNADTNNDGNVNISDVTTLINHLLSGQELDPKEPEQLPQTKTFTVNGVTFTMVNVDGGTFSMGCSTEVDTNALSDEMPIHQVTLSSYYIGQTEVTQELWQAVMGSNPSNFKNDPQHLQLPVENVRWNECQDFLARLNELTGESFRLPTEAEWEFAARGGNQSHNYTYAGSNDIYEVAWFTENSDNTTHVVGTKKPNELGLFDMTGNVCEWCSDRYGFYPDTPQTNPTGPETGASRIYRGGGWQKLKVNCRITRRQYFAPTTTRYFMGLRLVL